MEKSWFVRTYRDNDKNEILELLGFSRQLWEWYASNPYGYLIGLAECKSSKKIVGYMALTLTHIKIANETKQGSLAIELFVHPDFRRQGMFLAIGRFITTKAMEENIAVSLGFPNRFAHRGHLKYGWFNVTEISMFKRYASFKGFMMSRGILPKVNFIYHKVFHRRKQIDEGIKIKQVSSFGPEIDKLWKSIAKHYDLLVVRNLKYLNWRFIAKPNSTYQVFVAQKNEKILGYAVVFVKDTPRKKIGYIVDLFAHPNPSIIHSLVSHSIKCLKEQKADVILCGLLAKKPFYQVLRNNSFFPSYKIPLIARINTKETDIAKDYLKNYEKWYVTLGDSDL